MFSPCGLPALTNTALRTPFGRPPQPCGPPVTDRAALPTRYLPTPCILTARPCGRPALRPIPVDPLRPTRAALRPIPVDPLWPTLAALRPIPVDPLRPTRAADPR